MNQDDAMKNAQAAYERDFKKFQIEEAEKKAKLEAKAAWAEKAKEELEWIAHHGALGNSGTTMSTVAKRCLAEYPKDDK